LQGIAAVAEHLGGSAAREEADFESTYQLGEVVGMDALGGGGVEVPQKPVDRARAAMLSGSQAIAQGLVARGSRKKTVHKGTEIKTGSTGQDRDMPAMGDFGKHATGQAGVFAGAEYLVGIENIDQVMGNATAVLGWELGGADIEIAVNLQGIAVYDFTGEFFREGQGQLALTRPGWPQNRYNLVFRHHVLVSAAPRYTIKKRRASSVLGAERAVGERKFHQ